MSSRNQRRTLHSLAGKKVVEFPSWVPRGCTDQPEPTVNLQTISFWERKALTDAETQLRLERWFETGVQPMDQDDALSASEGHVEWQRDDA